MKTNDRLNKFIKDNIEEHKKSYDEDNLRDFIDLYLKSDPENGKSKKLLTKMSLSFKRFCIKYVTLSKPLKVCPAPLA